MLSGCTLILWSFYPKHVFKAIYNIVWGIPKSICLGFVRCLGFGRKGVGQSKAFSFFLFFSIFISRHYYPLFTNFYIYKIHMLRGTNQGITRTTSLKTVCSLLISHMEPSEMTTTIISDRRMQIPDRKNWDYYGRPSAGRFSSEASS